MRWNFNFFPGRTEIAHPPADLCAKGGFHAVCPYLDRDDQGVMRGGPGLVTEVNQDERSITIDHTPDV